MSNVREQNKHNGITVEEVTRVIQNPLKINQRVIVKKTGRYGVVNHQCGLNSFYLVRLDGEINFRGFSAVELKKGDQQ